MHHNETFMSHGDTKVGRSAGSDLIMEFRGISGSYGEFRGNFGVRLDY